MSNEEGPPILGAMSQGTDLRVRLKSELSAKSAGVGDKFTVTVLTQEGYKGATLDGHVASIITKSGKIIGRTIMNLAFDQITFLDGRMGRDVLGDGRVFVFLSDRTLQIY